MALETKRTPAVSPTLESYKAAYFQRLNDLHISAQITRRALKAYGAERAAAVAGGRGPHDHFVVPSGGKPTARIRRGRRDVDELIDRALREDEHRKSLVLAVSIVEDYLVNVLKLVLRAHPDRLARGRRGGEAPLTIRLDDFVRRDRDDLLEELMIGRINGALYAAPADYLAYTAAVLEFEVPPAPAAAFLEIKATRDIIVHANGQANARYVEKAGQRARAQVGKVLAVDAAYFDESVMHMKALVGEMHDRLCMRYADDEAVRRCAARFFD